MGDAAESGAAVPASGLRRVGGVLVLLAAWVNLAALLSLIYSAQFNVVTYRARFADDARSAVWPGAGALIGSGVVILALCAVTGRRRRAPRWDLLARSWTAAWPGAFAAAWLVPLWPGPPGGYFALLACALLIGWGLARVVYIGQPASEEISGQQPRPLHRDGVFGLLCIVGLVFAAFHTWVQVRLHQSLQFGCPDIGYYAEMLNNVLRGRGLQSAGFGHHYLAEHFSPIFYLLVPLWALWSRIELLMGLAALAIALGGLACYALARAYGAGRRTATVLALCYWLYPSVGRIIYNASYGFQPVLLAVPLVLWSFVFFVSRRRAAMWVCLLLALCCKEDVAVVYFVFGLYVFVRDRRCWWGPVLAAGCAALFFGYVYGLSPALHQTGEYSRYALFESLGGSPGGMLRTLISDPMQFLRRLVSVPTAGLAATLLVPVAGVALGRPVLLIAAPTFIFMCMVDERSFSTIRFWHQATLLPLIWWATIEAVCARGAAGRDRRWWLVAVVVCSLITHYALGFSPVCRGWGQLRETLRAQNKTAVIAELQRMIPPADAVQATPRLAAHFTGQDRLYPHHVTPPEPADWVLIDLRDSFAPPEELEVIAARIGGDARYQRVYKRDSIFAYRLRGTP